MKVANSIGSGLFRRSKRQRGVPCLETSRFNRSIPSCHTSSCEQTVPPPTRRMHRQFPMVWSILFRVALPLVAGLACYATLRPSSKFYVPGLSLHDTALAMFSNIPDALWAFAFCQTLFHLPGAKAWRDSMIVVFFGFSWELLQGTLLPGSPSIEDAALYVLAAAAAFITRPHCKNEK